MMASELEYLDSACEMHVLPQPKAPGMAQVPPSTDGKKVSMTRWPVTSARLPASFSRTGRALRTGQKCDMPSLWILPVASSTSSTVSSRVNSCERTHVRT